MTPREPSIIAVSALLLSSLLVVSGPPATAADPRKTFTQPQTIELNDNEATFEQPSPVTIPDAGTATPYPSQITIAHGGVVTHIEEVTIAGLTHPNPDDLDIMLVGPTGVSVMLMSDSGGETDLDNIFLRFVNPSGFEQLLPDEDPIDGQDYLPTDNGTGDDTFPDPAPAPSGATDFSAFVGTPVGGAWSLYVVDDATGAAGEIDEWAMEIGFTGTHYPSELAVSGLGTVTDVDVVIHDFATECAGDVDLLLVGPRGQQTAVLSDAGGFCDEAFAGLDLRFDDEALHTASQSQPLESTTYQPTDYDGDEDRERVDEYPAPAPTPGRGGEPANLSVFDGTNPNGIWRLFAYDDRGQFLTRIEGGWSLDIGWADATEPSGSVLVNGGAARTNQRNVSLTLSATDATPGTGLAQVRLSNDAVNWSPYVPYATALPWTLAEGDGMTAVFAQFKDGAGNTSAVVRDAIVLDTTGPKATRTKPAANATDVEATAKIRVWASEKLDTSTLRAATVTLKQHGDKVPAKVTFRKGGRVIVVDPKTDLEPGRYVLKVGPKVTDQAGNGWDQKRVPGRQPLKLVFRV